AATAGCSSSSRPGHGSTTAEDEFRDSVVSTATSQAHSLTVTDKGEVYGFGANPAGVLGDDTTTGKAKPARVTGLPDVTTVSTGQKHSLAVTGNGDVYAWGANEYGQLGDGTSKSRTEPARVTGLSDIARVAAGGAHSLAVTEAGDVYTWGSKDRKSTRL